MSKVESLKEQARRHEQKEDWGRACELYLEAIDRLDEEQPDIGLHNRVGDILIKLGSYDQAVEHFETAIQLYLDAELPNNAIAVCKKIIRHLPSRLETYLQMGKIRGSQGFLLDARENYLAYAERMQAAGNTEQALEALVELADLVPEDAAIRMAVATQLLHHDRGEEALTQLQAGYAAMMGKGDEEGAAELAEKILELDPDADLSAIAASGSGPDAYRFESTSLAGEDGGVAPAAESPLGIAGLESPSVEDTAPTEGMEEFAEISIPHTPPEGASEAPDDGSGTSDAGVDVAEEFALGGELPLMSFDETEDHAEPSPQPRSESADDGGGAAGPVESTQDFSLEPWADGEEGEPDPLPYLDLSEQRAGVPVEEVEGEAPEFEDISLGDLADEVDAPASGHGTDAAAEWERLRDACLASPEDATLAEQLVEQAFQVGEPGVLVESYLMLAAALTEGGQDSRAEAVFQQVLTLEPGNERALAALQATAAPPAPEPGVLQAADAGEYVDLGALIFGDEDVEKTTRFRVAYEEPSGDEEADFARLLTQFKEKVAKNFDLSDVKAHHDLGLAYKEMGLLDEAVEKFQAALRASPVHLPTYELLGQTFMEKGELTAAVRVLERALRVSSDVEDEFIGIYYYLARAHEELGSSNRALEYYDHVFALDINFKDVTERLRALR